MPWRPENICNIIYHIIAFSSFATTFTFTTMFSRTLSVASVVRRHCRSLSIKPSFTQLPSSSAPILCRHLSLKSPSEKEVPASEERDDTPNIIYYGLYTTLCYSGVYVGTLSAIYVALSSGVLSAETFDIDQMESVAKVSIYRRDLYQYFI